MSLQQNESHSERVRKTILRLFLTYLAPLIILTVYFYIQSNRLLSDSRGIHLQSIAEHQANTLDLYLRERVTNISNLIDNPRLEMPPSASTLQDYLFDLKRSSVTFVDIGFLDSSAIQVAYNGPFSSLEKQDYSSEVWFTDLARSPDNFIITDIYLGLRKKPHFTIAVSRVIKGQYIVIRASLDPEKIYDYINSLEGSGEVYTSIVSMDGYYQVVTPNAGGSLKESSVIPPSNPRFGVQSVKIDETKIVYGYSWLHTAEWALIVQWSDPDKSGFFSSGLNLKFIFFSLAFILIIFFVIISRSRKIVEFQDESISTKNQLQQASKLASLGELAAGIAHEINNPVAVMIEEAGWIGDVMDEDEFGDTENVKEIRRSLKQIKSHGIRCKEITHKLLSFARKTDPIEKEVQINDTIREVTELLEQHAKFDNIDLKLDLAKDLPTVMVSPTEMQQVLINLINNAIDAMESKKSGSVKITTWSANNWVLMDIADTGQGIPLVDHNRIFDPFFTTKPVGKGTGIGLSTVFGIISKLDGKISFDSKVGEGTTFHIQLHCANAKTISEQDPKSD